MYLKTLSLSGFKTFADNTKLEFGPGLTAIVGPNGSGKSNLVDAVVWALGERSNKALRGHAPTDVIFNGSADRKPVNMAEVSLFFENSDRALPLDFGEVQVTRRVFRDGDSEYAINKTNCRLRDVIDLFLDTGVGAEAYSVISQGHMDAILSAKPEDRRSLIEGAAGVQKYRSRRGETRRKLDRVEADLLRVSDITHELERQVGPLAEQAELAREHHNYVSRLASLQLAVLARDYDVRQKRLQGLQEAQATSAAAVLRGSTGIEELEATEAELEKQLRSMEGAMELLQNEVTDVVSRFKATEGSLAVARERRRALSEQQEFQAQEIGLLRARIATGAETVTAQRAELEAALQASASLSNAAADAEARLGVANAHLTEATRQLQAQQSQVIELMRASQSRREAAAGGRAETTALQNRLADLQRLATSLGAEIAQVSESLGKAVAELAASRRRQENAARECAAAQEAVQAAQAAQTQRRQSHQEAREQRSGAESRLGALRELEQNLEGVQGGARAVLGAIGRGQLPDNYVLVADAMRAPREFENAIEVALGGGVHNLICPADADAKSAIAWLKQHQAGRATFLPLPNLRPAPLGERTQNLLGQPGVRGLASQLVTFKAEYRAAIDYLLGRVLVVDDLDVAVALAKRCDFGVRLVTLDGELVLPAGAITGGQGKQKAAGLLARKRELDELESRLGTLDAQLLEGAAAVESAAHDLLLVNDALRGVQEESNALREAVARQEREVEHLEREGRRLEANREATQSQVKTSQAHLQVTSGEQDKHDSAASELDAQARELEAAVARAQSVVALRQAEREEVAAAVSEVRAQHSATQERLAAMRRSIAELVRQTADFEQQITTKQESLERALGEDAGLVGSEADLVSQVSQLQQRVQELETSTAQGRAHRQEALLRLEEAGSQLRTERSVLHEAEAELHRLQVRLASTETEIAELERRFAEEFELTLEAALEHRDSIEGKQAALDEIEILKQKIGSLGNVNTGAVEAHQQVVERLEFLVGQKADLDAARAQLEEIIADIDGRTHDRFMATFHGVQKAFEEMFTRIFDGGTTHLSLTHPDNLLETGIDLRVQLPSKAAQDVSLLSGGERALTALAFMLALLRVHPSPFVVLDEVDAPLDASNVGRFAQLLREFSDKTQFIVITHNSGMMQAADVLYGVTMQHPGVSNLMSVRLVDEVEPPAGGMLDHGAPNGHSHAIMPAKAVAAV